MGLMDAKEYDPAPSQKRNRLVVSALLVLILGLILAFWFRYWPEKHTIDRFFHALEAKNFEQAYTLYEADPDWRQHPDKYKDYSFNQFVLDWGPSGEYGPITSHHVDCATEPPKKGSQSPSGVIVVVTINGRQEPKSMWVEKKSKSITTSPWEALCH